MSQFNPSYNASTQFNNWRFSPERLLVVRSNLNAGAVAAIRNTFETDEVDCFLSAHPALNRTARIFSQCLVPNC